MTIKAIIGGDEWELEVLGVPFGRDVQGDIFDRDTNFHTDKFTEIPAVYYHGADEHGQPKGQPEYFGKARFAEIRDDGAWYRVVLDKTSEYAQRVWNAAQKGLARASSGSILHLVRRNETTGHVDEWPVVELTLLDAEGKRQPVNQRAVALPVMKAVYQQAGLNWPDDLIEQSEAEQGESDSGAVKTISNRRRALLLMLD